MAKRQPEEAIFQRMPNSLSKASKIRITKAAGMVKQEGRHLGVTAKGAKAAAKAERHIKAGVPKRGK